MLTIEKAIADCLPPDKFGEYIRDIVAERMQYYAWELTRETAKAFCPLIPEWIIREWFEERMRQEKEFWRTQEWPRMMEEMQRRADRHAAVRRGEIQEEE